MLASSGIRQHAHAAMERARAYLFGLQADVFGQDAPRLVAVLRPPREVAVVQVVDAQLIKLRGVALKLL